MLCGHPGHPDPPQIVSISALSNAPECYACCPQTSPYHTYYRTMHIEHSAADTHDAEDILPTAVARIHLLPVPVAERQSSRVLAAWVLRPILAAWAVAAPAARDALGEVACSVGPGSSGWKAGGDRRYHSRCR